MLGSTRLLSSLVSRGLVHAVLDASRCVEDLFCEGSLCCPTCCEIHTCGESLRFAPLASRDGNRIPHMEEVVRYTALHSIVNVKHACFEKHVRTQKQIVWRASHNVAALGGTCAGIACSTALLYP